MPRPKVLLLAPKLEERVEEENYLKGPQRIKMP
jgi:hypothetical protein